MAQALELLREGKPARFLQRKPEEERAFNMLGLLTSKPVLYADNVAEDEINSGNEHVSALRSALERAGFGRGDVERALDWLAEAADELAVRVSTLLALRGAEVLAVPAAFTLQTGKDHWELLLRARAVENQAFVVAPGAIISPVVARATYS